MCVAFFVLFFLAQLACGLAIVWVIIMDFAVFTDESRTIAGCYLRSYTGTDKISS